MTRMGLHIHTTYRMDLVERYCREVQPAVVKTLDPSAELVSMIRHVSHGTRIVFRHVWGDQDFDSHRDFTNVSIRRARECMPDFVEGYNEWGAKDERELARFSGHEIRFAQACNDAGLGAAIGGFSTGHLDPHDKNRFDGARAMLELCHERGGDNPSVIWHSHEYGGACMQWGVRTPDGRNQWDWGRNTWTGVCEDPALYWQPDLDGWWVLRYRMLWEVLEREGLTGVRMFFSETGIDDVNPRPGGQAKGWRDFAGTDSVTAVLGRPLICTAAWWTNRYSPPDWLNQYPLWVATYGREAPVVPRPWTDWAIWQWASKGPGAEFGAASEFIDRNRFRGTIEDLKALVVRPEPGMPVDAIRAAAVDAQAIQPNEDASLYNALREDDYWPLSDEFDVGNYRCQLAREWKGERERIYCVPIGRWSEVEWINR